MGNKSYNLKQSAVGFFKIREAKSLLRNNYVFVAVIAVCFACSDDPVTPDPYANIPKTGSVQERILDSIYLYSNEIWIWQNTLPSYTEFNPRRYSDISPELYSYNTALFELLRHASDPRTGTPYETPLNSNQLKYSFIQERKSTMKTEWLGTTELEGMGRGFGFEVGQSSGRDIRIAYVDVGSPASQADLKRGDRILSMNGEEVFNAQVCNSILNQQQEIEIQVISPDGKEKTAKLSKQHYQTSAVYQHRVIQVENGPIGYLAYARFSNDEVTAMDLRNVMDQFSRERVKTLIIDLRYNQGGYISNVVYLSNLICPNRLNGAVSFSEHFNKLMQTGRANVLKNQPYFDTNGNPLYIGDRPATYFDVDYTIEGNTKRFEKLQGIEGIESIYFIVSNNTASAAELLINIFRPYLKVTIIGESTFGKPVGFFKIQIDQYDLYLSSFISKNADGYGEYYNGFKPDVEVLDDLSFDFGDVREECLAVAIRRISNKGDQLEQDIKRRNSSSKLHYEFVKKGFSGLVHD